MADRGASRTLSVVDTGVSSAAMRVVRDAALLDAAAAGRCGAVLEFSRLRPAVLIGRYQWADTEIRRDYCIRHGIETVRRLTGGEAVYVDEEQLVWSLALPETGGGRRGLAAALGEACRGVAGGLARLGVEARFAPPDTIEVAGRRIAACHARPGAGALLVQGTAPRAIDIGRMLHALRVPTEKLSPQGLAGARRRSVALDDLLGGAPAMATLRDAVRDGLAEAFGLSVAAAEPCDIGTAAVADAGGTAAAPRPVGAAEAMWPCAGGVLRARACVSGAPPRIGSLDLAGDVMMDPPDLFERIAERLRGAGLSSWRAGLAALFAEEEIELVGCTPRDIGQVVSRALERHAHCGAFGLDMDEANRLVIHNPHDLDAAEIVRRATVMLVPYCAKAVECKWRRRAGCPECGLCEVGDAYRIARERGLRAITITNYEHLVETLAALKRDGVAAYLGMCCSQFYLKRNKAFAEAGIAAVLMDISGANCYELHREEQAYAGAFEAKAELDIPLLEKVTAVKRG